MKRADRKYRDKSLLILLSSDNEAIKTVEERCQNNGDEKTDNVIIFKDATWQKTPTYRPLSAGFLGGDLPLRIGGQ
jgi:hypothetical protein